MIQLTHLGRRTYWNAGDWLLVVMRLKALSEALIFRCRFSIDYESLNLSQILQRQNGRET